MIEKLLACPFCGESARISSPATSHDGDWSVSNEYSYITCKDDRCVINKQDYSCQDYAIAAWNTRYPENKDD